MTYLIWEGDLDVFDHQKLNARISETIANNSCPHTSNDDISRAEALKFRKELWENNHQNYSQRHIQYMKKGLFGGPYTYESFLRK